MFKFWQKKYISKYTGAEIDNAIGKITGFIQDGTELKLFESLIKAEFTVEQVTTLFTTGALTNVDVTIADSYTWPVLEGLPPAYLDAKLPDGQIVRARLAGESAYGMYFSAVINQNGTFYVIVVGTFHYNPATKKLTCSLSATAM